MQGQSALPSSKENPAGQSALSSPYTPGPALELPVKRAVHEMGSDTNGTPMTELPTSPIRA